MPPFSHEFNKFFPQMYDFLLLVSFHVHMVFSSIAKSKAEGRQCTRKDDIWERANENLVLIRGMQDEQVYNHNSNIEVVCSHHFLMMNFDALLNLDCLINFPSGDLVIIQSVFPKILTLHFFPILRLKTLLHLYRD
jgi:hypothetical protein